MPADRLMVDAAVTQFAVLDALLVGAYESGISPSEVRTIGDFGIGCTDLLGGEVVILNGEIFQCTLDAPPEQMTDGETLPFVNVCHFPDVVAEQVENMQLDGLTSRIENGLVSRNLFHAVRVDGVFTSLLIRITPRQHHPFRPLAEVTKDQVETVLENVHGTLVGFWAPGIYQGITVAGLHLHFLADDRTVGGHVLDVTVGTAELRSVAYARLNLRLPTDELFLRTELTHGEDHRILAVEGGARTVG